MSGIMLPKFWIKCLWDRELGSWACWPGATHRAGNTGGKWPGKGAERHREKTHMGQRRKEV